MASSNQNRSDERRAGDSDKNLAPSRCLPNFMNGARYDKIDEDTNANRTERPRVLNADDGKEKGKRHKPQHVIRPDWPAAGYSV
jgi:hypothetical protein